MFYGYLVLLELSVDSSLDILFTFPLLDYFSLTLTLYDDISLYINNTQLEP